MGRPEAVEVTGAGLEKCMPLRSEHKPNLRPPNGQNESFWKFPLCVEGKPERPSDCTGRRQYRRGYANNTKRGQGSGLRGEIVFVRCVNGWYLHASPCSCERVSLKYARIPKWGV